MKTVLITGGGRGLGLAVAQQLTAAGARVVLAVRDPGRVTGCPGRADGRPGRP
jgi:NAD(P)-dependent dehydrogenase (short-subunit alcohol dehydrogenase family)